MANYCSECVEWISSKYDATMDYHNGRLVVHKWCSYSGKPEAEDQNVYGCPGFHYVERTVITKICEILKINPKELFNAFDETKEKYIVPTDFGKLVDYNMVGLSIVDGLDRHPQKEVMALNMLNGYIIPAEAYAKKEMYDKAVEIYERMVKVLAIIFGVTKEKREEQAVYNNLIRVR